MRSNDKQSLENRGLSIKLIILFGDKKFELRIRQLDDHVVSHSD